jgi:Pectate lyase superfamily protein
MRRKPIRALREAVFDGVLVAAGWLLFLSPAVMICTSPLWAQGAGALKAPEIYSPTGQVTIYGLADKAGQLYNGKAYGAVGNGVNDDTTAIQAAITALPSCTHASQTWSHCGKVYLPNGTYKTTGPLSISSPFVRLEGESTGGVTLAYYGTSGCAIEWTSTPFNTSQPDSVADGLFNLTIDGAKAAAGTCGLETLDMIGFHAWGVNIGNFLGVGSSGWLDDTLRAFNERFDVSMNLENNTTDWQITTQPGAAHRTFGYGFFHVTMTTVNSGIGLDLKGDVSHPPDLENSLLMLVINGPSSSTGIKLENNSTMTTNSGTIVSDHPTTSVDATWGVFSFLGELSNVLGSVAGNASYLHAPRGVGLVAQGYDHLHGLWLQTNGQAGHLVLAPPVSMPSAVTVTFPSASGTLATSNQWFGADQISAGTIAISSATSASHSFSTAYTSAPYCTLTPTTDPTAVGAYWATSTTGAVTANVHTRGTITFNFNCTPAAN